MLIQMNPIRITTPLPPMVVILTILITLNNLMILLVIKLRPTITRVAMRFIRLRIHFHGQHLLVNICSWEYES